MSIKYYCDFCGKESFHMDVVSCNGKHICPDCMKVRCRDMAKMIIDADLDSKRIEHIKYLYTNLNEIFLSVDIKERD